MRRLLMLGGLVLAFGLGLAAQSLSFFPFAPGTAFPELVPPCPADRVEPQIVVIDGQPQGYGIWHCLDGRFIPYKFTTIAALPPGDPTTTQPTAAPTCPGNPPFPGGVCQDGGWLPPNSPLLRR